MNGNKIGEDMSSSMPAAKRQRPNEDVETAVQGSLNKCGSGPPSAIDSWRKRWFVLTNTRLRYYRGKTALMARQISGELDVSGAKVYVEDDESGVERRLSIVASSGASLLLAAARPDNAHAWLAALEAASKKQTTTLPQDHNPTADHTTKAGFRDDGIPLAAVQPADVMAQQEGVATLLVMEVVDGPAEGSRFEIDPAGVTICRNPSGITATHHKVKKEIHIPDVDISRRHAEVRSRDGVYCIRDLGSLNGSTVNGVRLSEERKSSGWKELNGGDAVTFGKTKVSVFFRVKVLNPPISEALADTSESDDSKEEAERRRKKAERRIRRDERREERASRREAAAKAKESRQQAQSQSAAAQAVRDTAAQEAATKSAQSAASFLNDILGAGQPQPSLRPNTHALTNIIGGVVDHNERLKEEEEEASKRRLQKMTPNKAPPPFPPPPPKPDLNTPAWMKRGNLPPPPAVPLPAPQYYPFPNQGFPPPPPPPHYMGGPPGQWPPHAAPYSSYIGMTGPASMPPPPYVPPTHNGDAAE